MTRTLLLAVALGALLVAACNDDATTTPGTPQPTARPTVHLEPGDMFVTEMMRKELAQLEDPLQSQLAADGRFTRDEYERLVYAYIQCITEAGSTVARNDVDAAGNHNLEIGIPLDASRGAVDKCTANYWEPLAVEWSFHHRPPEDLIMRADEALANCLREAGIDPPRDPQGGLDLPPLFRQPGGPPSAVVPCMESVAAEFKLPGFAGR